MHEYRIVVTCPARLRWHECTPAYLCLHNSAVLRREDETQAKRICTDFLLLFFFSVRLCGFAVEEHIQVEASWCF